MGAGGRQLDYSPSALDMLPAIVEAVDGRVLVWMDGGIRRGTDVLKVCQTFVSTSSAVHVPGRSLLPQHRASIHLCRTRSGTPHKLAVTVCSAL